MVVSVALCDVMIGCGFGLESASDAWVVILWWVVLLDAAHEREARGLAVSIHKTKDRTGHQ